MKKFLNEKKLHFVTQDDSHDDKDNNFDDDDDDDDDNDFDDDDDDFDGTTSVEISRPTVGVCPPPL